MAIYWRKGLTIPKDPDATKRRTFSVAQWLPTGSTLAADPNGHVVTADTGITIDSSSNDDDSITVDFSGGTDGTTYDMIFQWTTTDGLTDQKTVKIKVSEE